jgi:hypothetical protein
VHLRQIALFFHVNISFQVLKRGLTLRCTGLGAATLLRRKMR